MTETYHMLEYIRESPAALERTIFANEAELLKIAAQVKEKNIQRIVITGLGSSYTAALIAAPLFIRHSRLPVQILPATELTPYLPGLQDRKTLLIAVSRSGERGWVVDSFQAAIQQGIPGVVVTGTPGSLLAQKASTVLLTREGPEITFAKTKSVTTCAGLLARLALALAAPEDLEAQIRVQKLWKMPKDLAETITACETQIQALMPSIQHHKIGMVGGTLSNYGAAVEGALKIQESGGAVMMANDTGDILHGPWGPVTSDWLITLLVTDFDRELCEKTLSLAGKFQAKRMVIAEPEMQLSQVSEFEITLPVKPDLLMSGLIYLAPLQLLTYSMAIANQLNPDAPANMRAMLDAMLPPGREEPELKE